MNENRNIPRMRFPEYIDSWENIAFGSLVQRKSKTQNASSNLPSVEYDDVEPEIGQLNKDVYSKQSSKKGIEFDDKDVLYGKLRPYLHHWLAPSFKGVATGDWWVLTPKNTDRGFIYSIIQTDEYDAIANQSSGSKMPRSDWNTVARKEFAVPSDIKEQQRIGSFFSKIDSVIALQQQYVDQLKEFKKGCLQKIFPKKGEKVPEMRFPGFSDAWEQRKLGDCFSSLQNNTLSRADLNDENGAAMNVHYGDVLIKFNECLDISKEHLPYIEEKDIVDKFKTSYLQNGDIVIADTAEDETVGKCTEIIGLSDQKVISGLHTIPLRPNIKFASGYLGFYLNSDSYHEQLKPLMQGIKVTSISKNAMQDTIIRYPDNTREQGLIGQYFLNLDRLITLYQRKLDEMKEFKKGCLQKMFV